METAFAEQQKHNACLDSAATDAFTNLDDAVTEDGRTLRQLLMAITMGDVRAKKGEPQEWPATAQQACTTLSTLTKAAQDSSIIQGADAAENTKSSPTVIAAELEWSSTSRVRTF